MAFTLNRRLAQLVDSNGQLNTGKIPNDYISSDHIADNVITSAMLHTSFTVSTSNLTAIDTDDVSEGSTNLYYTDARADARIAAATTDDLTEGSTNLYYTDTRVGDYIYGNRTYGSINSIGNISVAAGTGAKYLIVRSTSNQYSQIFGYGIRTSPGTSTYSIWPVANDSSSLDFGNFSSTLNWKNVRFHSTNGLSIGYTQFIDSSRNLTNIGTISSGAITSTGEVEATALDINGNGDISGNLTLGGYLAGPATFTIDPAAVGDNTGTVVIAGNLQVDGTTTTINSTTVNVDDLNLTLASGAANSAAANGAGITVDGASATITYDGTNDEWDFNKDINVAGSITGSIAASNIDSGRLADARMPTTIGSSASTIFVGTLSGNANTASNTPVYATGSNATHYVTFASTNGGGNSSGAGSQARLSDGGLTYNPSTNALGVSGNISAGTISTGTITGTGDIDLGDNNKILLGASDDLQIYHDGSYSYIREVGTGDLRIAGASNVQIWNSDIDSQMANFANGGAVTLYYGGNPRIATTSTGIDITGALNTTGGSVTMNKSVASGAFLTDANIYPLRLTNDDTTAGNAVGLSFGQGGFDFTNFIASVRTGTGNDPKGDLVFGGRPSDGSPFLERMRIQANGQVGIGTDDIGTHSLLDVFGGAVQIINNAASFEGSTADASLHIKGAEPSQDRLTQLSAVGTSKKALNLIASTDSNDADQWWSWGVDTDDQFKILHGTSFSDALSGIRIQNTGNLVMGNTLYFNNATDSSSIANSSGSLYLNSDNSMYFRTYDGSWQTRLTILDGGNVGIGTNTPQRKLTVTGSADSPSDNTGIFSITDGTGVNTDAKMQFGITSNGHGYIHSVKPGTDIKSLLLAPAGGSGRVGIGMSTTPLKPLHLQRTAPTSVGTPDADTMILLDHDGDQYIEFRTTGTDTGTMQGNLFTDNGPVGFIGYKQYTAVGVNGNYGESIHIGLRDFSGTDQYNGIYLGNTAADVAEGVNSPHMFIKSGSGNVGIGTVSNYSTAKLQVKTATNVNLGFQTGTTETTGFKINAYNDAGNANIPLELNGSVVVLKTGEARRMTIDASGNVNVNGGNIVIDGDQEIQFLTQSTSTAYGKIYASDYPSQGYTSSGAGSTVLNRFWPTISSAGGVFLILNTDGGAGASENTFDSFVVWQGNRDGDKLFKVSNAGNTSTRRLAINSAGSETTFIPNGSGLDRVDLMVRSYASGEKNGQVIACDNDGEAHLYMVDTANASGNAGTGANSGGWGLNIYYDGMSNYPYNLRTGLSGTWTKREQIDFNGTREFMNSNLQHNDAGKSVQWKWFTTPSYWYAATTGMTTTNFNVNGGWTYDNGNSLPSNVKAIYVTYYYHIGSYGTGSVGQGDHASDLWGPVTPSNTTSWSFTTSGNVQWGSAVFMHDGDASNAVGGDILYYGAWYPGAMIAVNSNNNIYGRLSHGYSGGTHYHHMYCWGYAT